MIEKFRRPECFTNPNFSHGPGTFLVQRTRFPSSAHTFPDNLLRNATWHSVRPSGRLTQLLVFMTSKSSLSVIWDRWQSTMGTSLDLTPQYPPGPWMDTVWPKKVVSRSSESPNMPRILRPYIINNTSPLMDDKIKILDFECMLPFFFFAPKKNLNGGPRRGDGA